MTSRSSRAGSPPSQTPTIDPDTPRCQWPGIEDPAYARYHDEEWGVPHAHERRLFEKLILEGFQAGLSWLTILKKRAAFRAAFADFDPDVVAGFGTDDVARLMGDAGIVRNRAKIEATIANARAYCALRETTTLADVIWGAVDGKPIVNHFQTHSDVPGQTDLSKSLSKTLKGYGFRFVGPTTVYAALQSSGVVNDHLVSCHRHRACAQLQEAFRHDA